jgi:glycerophosphoryl diester phosphodiesterase
MGIAYHYPMNTLPSLNDALEAGADGVEMDVQLSLDSVLILLHPQDLSGSTGCSGKVSELHAESILKCEYRRTLFSKPAPVITADQFFSSINPTEYFFTFECKIETDDTSSYPIRFARALNRHILQFDLSARCFIESYNHLFFEALHALNPSLKLFMYTSAVDTSGKFVTTPISGITIDLDRVDAAGVRSAHRNGLQVSVFNARTESGNVKAITIGADNIQTDRVKHLVEVLK